MAVTLGKAIGEELDALAGQAPDALRAMREARFLQIGA
jgi:acetyl-CoA carboxylase carboxyl transferase subunit alpha